MTDKGRKAAKSFGWGAMMEGRRRKRPFDPDREVIKGLGAKVRWRTVMDVTTFVLALIIAMQLFGQSAPPAPIKPDFDPTGKQAAYASVQSWLSSGEPLGAGSRIVSWDGASTETMSDGHDDIRVTRHTMTVENGVGRWWKVKVTIGRNKPIGPPTAEPMRVPHRAERTQVDWKGTLGSLTPSNALSTTIDQWAQALMGSDADRLTTIVHDPDPKAVYQPLMLGAVQSATIEKGAYLNRGKINRQDKTSDRAVVRATVVLAPHGQNLPTTSMEFDLLIGDPDGTPQILAWGAPGEGPALREHGNRWHGAPLTLDDDGSPQGSDRSDKPDQAGRPDSDA